MIGLQILPTPHPLLTDYFWVVWWASGKVLQEKKTLGSYLVQPGGVLTVTMAKSPAKSSTKVGNASEGKEGKEHF